MTNEQLAILLRTQATALSLIAIEIRDYTVQLQRNFGVAPRSLHFYTCRELENFIHELEQQAVNLTKVNQP